MGECGGSGGSGGGGDGSGGVPEWHLKDRYFVRSDGLTSKSWGLY
jgi:hypothetical protein